MEWKKLEDESFEQKESEVVKFEEAGQEFIGKFIGIVEYENDNGAGHFYKFEDVDDSELEYIVFGITVLDTKMKRVALDSVVKIVYKGKQQSAKNKSRYYKDFDIFVGQ